MKVAFVLGTSAGGTGRHVKMLAAGCAARGMPVAVFGPAQTDRTFGFTTGDVSFAAVDIGERPRLLADLRAIARLRRLITAGQPDLVHAHGLRAGALTAIALAFARRSGGSVPAGLVVTVHNAPPEGGLAGPIYRVLELIVARNADSVLCVSPDLEQRMRAAGARRAARAVVPAPAVSLTAPPAGQPEDVSAETRSSFVPPTGPPATSPPADVSAETRAAFVSPTGPPATSPPADVSAETRAAFVSPTGPPVASPPADVSAETRAAATEVPRGPVVLAVGRLAAQKGFGTLLAAAALWRDMRPQPVLVIAGDGPLEAELRGQADALGLTVEFAGHRPDVPELLAAAAVFVLPSAWEGQPLVLQEALRAGVPIVATRTGGTTALAGEDAALLIPPGDPERLASAVRVVLTEPALAARLRSAALERAAALPAEADAVTAALAEYDLVRRSGGAVKA